MIPVTANKKPQLEHYERKVEHIRRRTKRVTLVGGPFHEQDVRIDRSYDFFGGTVPKHVAKNYQPLSFDGVPDVPEDVVYLAYYEKYPDKKQFEFVEVKVYKKTDESLDLPLGYEEVQMK